ncbi:MAG TPA: insulinase family protein, partial [Candidatus Dormibacteraeota bacterium]
FFRTYYTPSNAVLTLAGDFDPEAALDRVEAWFGNIPAGPPVPPVIVPATKQTGERREVLPDAVRLPRVYIGFRAPAYGERAWYAADMLSAVLTGGKSSPLYRDLVYDRQIAQDVGASVSPYEKGGTFMMVATARPGVEVETLEKALLEHVAAAATTLPDPDELERARNRMLTDTYSSLQKLDGVADLFSQFATYFDDPAGVAAEAGRYLQISPEELMEVAATHLTETERVVLQVVPRAAS